MERSRLPLNALRAFETAARHLNVTRAALELRVTQAAVSHHIKLLEDQLGARLFRRLPRGLALTDEGAALAPIVSDTLDRMAATLDRFAGGRFQEIVSIGVVATFVTGWLLPRLPDFNALHPGVDLRIMTNNNRVDLAGDGLDLAIRYGDGAWHGTDAVPILEAPLTPLCAPSLARRLQTPADLQREVLLRSYRPDEWKVWFDAAGLTTPAIRSPVFDASSSLAAAASSGLGVALLPARLFEQDLASGRLAQPFSLCVDAGRYWLTRLKSRPETPAMAAVKEWLQRSD
ncbi:LysR family transcriptional regulator [Phenylobacterium aquaticum]|uniref:LysR family transcriptional regulator n=1 Tax=Phenylobacterium aquaticum TaxID=1763816 RepID=UPI0026F09204|nr:LysR family transcriptional regulator [Phenylobacterium aquaticum]